MRRLNRWLRYVVTSIWSKCLFCCFQHSQPCSTHCVQIACDSISFICLYRSRKAFGLLQQINRCDWVPCSCFLCSLLLSIFSIIRLNTHHFLHVSNVWRYLLLCLLVNVMWSKAGVGGWCHEQAEETLWLYCKHYSTVLETLKTISQRLLIDSCEDFLQTFSRQCTLTTSVLLWLQLHTTTSRMTFVNVCEVS